VGKGGAAGDGRKRVKWPRLEGFTRKKRAARATCHFLYRARRVGIQLEPKPKEEHGQGPEHRPGENRKWRWYRPQNGLSRCAVRGIPAEEGKRYGWGKPVRWFRKWARRRAGRVSLISLHQPMATSLRRGEEGYAGGKRKVPFGSASVVYIGEGEREVSCSGVPLVCRIVLPGGRWLVRLQLVRATALPVGRVCGGDSGRMRKKGITHGTQLSG